MKMDKNRREIILAAGALLLALLLAGCMNAGNRTNESPNEAKPSDMPYVATDPERVTTPAPTQQAPMGAGNSGRNAASDASAEPYDWRGNAAQVEERIGQFSEIADSTIVVNGNTALVGVEFDPQYRGEMTERIRQMIAGVVMSFDAQVQTVAVTAEAEDVKTIRDLAVKMAEGDETSIKTAMDKIIRNTTTLS